MPDRDEEQHKGRTTPMPQPNPVADAPEKDAVQETDMAGEPDAAPETDAGAETNVASESDDEADERLSEEQALEILRKHQQAYRQRIEDAKARIRTRAEWRRAKAVGRTYTYTVQPGDTLETVAKIFYAKPERWPEIYAANAERVAEPGDEGPQPVEPGTELVIP